MGCCVSQSPSKEGPQTTEKKYTYQPTNGNNLPSDLISASNVKSKFLNLSLMDTNINTLQDRLMDEQQLDIQQWKKLHSTSNSVIVKRPRKKKREPTEARQEQEGIKSIVSQLRLNENIEGNIIQEQDGEKLKIGNEVANIEFLLPRSRGGPLVVPHLLYQNYSSA